MVKVNFEHIGCRIRCAHESVYGLNKQISFAKHLDISPSMLTLILNGDIESSASRFFTICNYLRCKPSYLITGADQDVHADENIDINREFDNGDIRRVWQMIRKNAFPNLNREKVKVGELADAFGVSDAYITYRDYEYSRPRQVTISLVDIVKLCEVYNIPIDAIWCYLNGINF